MRRAAGTALAAIAVIDQVVFSCIHTKPIAHSLSTHISAELASLSTRSSTLQPLTCYCEHFITLRAIACHRHTPPRTHRCAVLAVHALYVGCLMRHVRGVDHCGPRVARDSAVRSPKLKRRLRTGSHTFITLVSCHVRLPPDLMSAARFAHDTTLS